MKKFLLVLWLLAGIAIILWHFGPGQLGWHRDKAASLMKQAEKLHRDGKAELAVTAYEQAITILPPEDTESRAKARVGLAKAQMDARALPKAREDMEALLNELPPSTDPELLLAVRTTLAETQYYNTWLMRLEGAPREVWEPEVESARQLFRNNAESLPAGHQAKDENLRNLESTVRLSRLELTELQAVPIPSKCRGCKSCKGSKKGPQPKQKQPAGEDVRSAGGALEMDNSGD